MFRCIELEEPAKNGYTYFLANHTEMCHFVRRLHSVGNKLHLNGVLENNSFFKMCLGQKLKEKTVIESAKKFTA